uniref:Uncharacterized protein n=1 Tax=Acrobeloides nanus TaxID=290746 RepID=A0A914EDM5_9BILA
MHFKPYFLLKFAIYFQFSNLVVSAISKDDDLIQNLPGLIFDIGVKQYSGYFNLSSGNLIHYWLIEAQSDPETKPLILWLNGGPGCSSLIGLFEELGPFRPNPDGKTLFENIFSWNKVANLLFFESPRDVGFSYRDPHLPPNNTYNDDYVSL